MHTSILVSETGDSSWKSDRLIIKRSRVRVPAGGAVNFLLQSQLSVLTLILVSLSLPCYRSGMQKIPVILP